MGSGFYPLINFLKGLFENPEPASRLLPAFAESPVRKGEDECEKDIHRSLLTAIASAAGVGEGGSASAGSAEDVKMPRAPVLRSSATAEGGAARGASPVEDENMTRQYYAHSLEGKPPSEWQPLEVQPKRGARTFRFCRETVNW